MGINFILGATHWTWRPDVEAVVYSALSHHHGLTANTYVDHPWPGWDTQSVDFWGPGGRGDPLSVETARSLRRYIHNFPGGPSIRHSILGKRLWTSWGGWSLWDKRDHVGRLRHLHVTYW
jgi:hypothetical protein